jgi:hypothetical protein
VTGPHRHRPGKRLAPMIAEAAADLAALAARP